MHELSIAQSIVDLAVSEARKHPALAIKTIKIRLGEFTSVVREALELAFDAVALGTLAAAATLEIEVVPLATQCFNCRLSFCPAQGFCFLCTRCGAPVEIVAGTEMQVEYIELFDRQEVS